MKAVKLSPFSEDKDDLDACLVRFEWACTAFEVHQEHRLTQLTQLARLLQGKALEVYQWLTDDENKFVEELGHSLMEFSDSSSSGRR